MPFHENKLIILKVKITFNPQYPVLHAEIQNRQWEYHTSTDLEPWNIMFAHNWRSHCDCTKHYREN
jgi:hypothetical protein